MPIPEERLPEIEESFDETSSVAEPSGLVDSLADEDELEIDAAATDESEDEIESDPEPSEADTAGFGYGEPAD
jgi:hypothetical protein